MTYDIVRNGVDKKGMGMKGRANVRMFCCGERHKPNKYM
jgi:hypothetical protein